MKYNKCVSGYLHNLHERFELQVAFPLISRLRKVKLLKARIIEVSMRHKCSHFQIL